MDMFNFDDDEPKKKKKAKPKKGKKKRTTQTKEFYETKITALNGRLAQLRSIFKTKNEVNRKLAEELTNIEEDHEDVCEFLDRTIKDRKATIIELHSTLKKLEIQRDEYKAWSQQRIIDLQKQYETDEKQMQNEIILQKKTLNSLDEFRLMRDAALTKYEEHHDSITEFDRKLKEDLYNMEQKAVVQKNVLKQEVEDRLHYLVEDFLHSYEIRNAGYTRSLIQENIVLTKRVDRLVKQNVRTMEEREKQYLKTKEIMESYTSLQQLSEQLRRTIENKNVIVQQLTTRIDRMRMKYIDARRFRRLHDLAKSRQLFDKCGPRNFEEVVQFLERLNNEKNAIIQQQRLQESEIQRMRSVLDTLQVAVERTILALQQLGPGESLDATDRRAIISELIFLTISESEEEKSCYDGIYRLGECGLILPEHRYDVPLHTLFFRSAPNPSSEILSKSDSSVYHGLHATSYHALSTIDECSSEQRTSCTEVIGDDPNKKLLEKEWLKIDLLADTIKTADRFENCFENATSCIIMGCNPDLSNSTVSTCQASELGVEEQIKAEKRSYHR